MRQLLIVAGLLFFGCASASAEKASYVRTDGRPVKDLELRAMVAQCQAEAMRGASETERPSLTGMLTRSSREATFMSACMARNGYVAR